MFRRTFLVLLAASAATCSHADWFGSNSVRGSGTVKSESREVGAFNGISLALPAVLDLKLGDKESVVIETDDNILPLIESVVESGSLKLRFRDQNTNVSTRDIRIAVTARKIDALSVAGSGDIRAPALKGDSLAVKISGSGDVRIGTLEVASVKVGISGSGDFTAGGKADTLEASIAGSGDLKAAKLETKRASVKIAGSGDARVWARESLSVSVAGSGDIGYYGDPKISQSVAGAGSIKRLGAAPG